MEIKIKGKVRDLKYSFNSFRYMEDFNIEEVNTLDRTPFKIARITETMFRGALNHNPKDLVSDEDILKTLEKLSDEGELVKLFEHLSELLEKSAFFQSLQENPKRETKKKEK